MMYIEAAKQVGPVYYYVDNIYTLYNIIDSEQILPTTERYKNKNIYYVSLSRDPLIQPKRRPNRWKYGLIIDGNKLSNRYSISPVNDGNTEMSLGIMKVKYIAKYQDKARLSIADRATFDITISIYEQIKDLILNMSDEEKSHLGFYIDDEEVKSRIGFREELIGFKARHGGLKLDKNLSDSLKNELLKSDALYEREERINLKYPSPVSISECIEGIYVPKEFGTTPEESEIYETIYQLLENQLNDTVIKRY